MATRPKPIKKSAAEKKKRRVDAARREIAKGVRSVSPLHAKIIQRWFQGGCKNWRKACVDCGVSPDSSTEIYARMDVQGEIALLRERHRTEIGVDVKKITDELAKIAFANLGDLLEVDDEGNARVDMGMMLDHHRSAVGEYSSDSEVRYDEEGNPIEKKRVKVKMLSKQAALEALARINGMFKDQVVLTGEMNFIDQVRRARERLAKDRDGE